MRVLSKFEKRTIPGRGTVFYGKIPEEEALPKVGQKIKINRKEYVIRGLEYAVLPVHPPRRGANVGIWVYA